MTETTTPTPTPQELRVTADALEAAEWYATAAQIRSAASALDAKGETTGEKLDRARAVMIRTLDALESDADLDARREAFSMIQDQFEGVSEEDHARAESLIPSLREPAAPPLALSSEQGHVHVHGSDPTCYGCVIAAPREPQPSSEIPWQDAYEVTHVNGKPVSPSSEASAPQTDDCPHLRQTEVCIREGGGYRLVGFYCEDCQTNFTAEPREPQPSSERCGCGHSIDHHSGHIGLCRIPGCECDEFHSPSSEASAQPFCHDTTCQLNGLVHAGPCSPRKASAPQTEETMERIASEIRDKIGVVFHGANSSPLDRAIVRKQAEDFLIDLVREALREPREPHAALVKEKVETAFEMGWNAAKAEHAEIGAPDYPAALDKCKAAILGGQG